MYPPPWTRWQSPNPPIALLSAYPLLQTSDSFRWPWTEKGFFFFFFSSATLGGRRFSVLAHDPVSQYRGPRLCEQTLSFVHDFWVLAFLSFVSTPFISLKCLPNLRASRGLMTCGYAGFNRPRRFKHLSARVSQTYLSVPIESPLRHGSHWHFPTRTFRRNPQVERFSA